ncbi:type II secretion system F family protein [Pyruvatibacter sp. HU-CL02332]|uniref:type II secretion system F family protein n=1 Tax=Pyruvatibacter sp. HU-CL02332 TaxID=3127650 RepID=UPI0031092076
MFDAQLVFIATVFMGVLGIGGVAYAAIVPALEKRSQSNKRMTVAAGAKRGRGAGRGSSVDPNAERRKQVQDTLKELDEAQAARKKTVTMRARIEQAGLDVSPRNFTLLGATGGLVVAGLLMLSGQPPLIGLLAGFAAGFGFPRWLLGYLKTRRLKQFTEEFANAVDVIVRGLKAGLPLHDCITIISTEAQGPVREEFKELVEGQRIGITLEQGLEKMTERVPLADLRFFQIVISIQQKTGGNLSEALGNLSKVLRDRKVLQGKITAMSQEAKSSAAIIGVLPPGVMTLVYITTPDYINLLFEERMGQAMLIGGALWMLCGILVMKKMITFDY